MTPKVPSNPESFEFGDKETEAAWHRVTQEQHHVTVPAKKSSAEFPKLWARMLAGQEHGLRLGQPSNANLATYVAVGKFLNLSAPDFPHQ